MFRTKRLIYAAALVVLAAVAGGAWWFMARREPTLRQQARSAYANREWNQAFNLAARQLRQEPDDTAATLIMARAARRLKRDPTADQLYAKLKKLNEAEDYFLQADLFLRHSKFPQAEDFLKDALFADPNHEEALKTLTEQLSRTNRPAEALEYAKRWSAAQPASTDATLCLGQLHDQLNHPEEASAAFAKAIQTSDNSESTRMSPSSARKLLAHNLLKIGKAEEARGVLEQAAILGPDRELLWLQSRAQLQLGHKAEALAFLEKSKLAAGDGSATGLTEEPAAFTGAESCRDCHAGIFDDQQQSRHALTFHHGRDAAQLPWNKLDGDNPNLPDSRVTFNPAEKQPASVIFQNQGQELQTLVKYIMGSGRHAVTPITTDAEGRPRESRMTYYAAIHGWDVTPGQPSRPKSANDWIGIVQTPDMLRLCLNCHTTNASAVLAEKGPELADRGIGCERCHGPAGNHLAAMKMEFPDKAIGRFRRNSSGSRPQAMQMCAECHGTLGREIAQQSDAAIVRFQSTTLTFSACYKKSETTGGFDCLTCHSPHQNAETDLKFYDNKCLKCHDSPKTGSEKTVVCKINPKQDCINCHMPKIDSIQPHAKFTDHQIRRKPVP